MWENEYYALSHLKNYPLWRTFSLEGDMGEQTVTTVKPDGKGRITLGKLLEGVSSVRVSVEEDGRIILEPYQEIPQREAWLYEDKDALDSVRAGLRQVAEGRVSYLGSFAAYAEVGEAPD